MKLASWWASRQGLLEVSEWTAEEAIESTGWLRSVGGMAPYLSLFARAGLSRTSVDQEVASQKIHELPSARGCVHILPKADYALGLSLAYHFGSDTGFRPASKHYGFTQEELSRLEDRALQTLASGALDPKDIRKALGDEVRTFPPEAKKHGITTSLPMALASLQRTGKIRRIPVDGRLDGERYLYALWQDGPLPHGPLSQSGCLADLASLYWSWIGAASLKHFQWFSGVSLTKCREASSPLGLAQIDGTDLLARPEDLESLSRWQTPDEPLNRFVSSLDTILMGRRDLLSITAEADRTRPAYQEKGVVSIGSISDVSSHMIIDRGQIAGFWDYDPAEHKIVSHLWRQPTKQFQEELERTEAFIRDEIGDARSFSLDSPASRQGRLEFLRSQAAG